MIDLPNEELAGIIIAALIGAWIYTVIGTYLAFFDWKMGKPKRKRKRKRSQNPEDIFLQECLWDCQIYGEPRSIFISQNFWDKIKNTNLEGYSIHGGLRGLKFFKCGDYHNTVSIVFWNGTRKDYNYKGGHR